MESESPTASTTPTYKRIQMWTDGETRQLLDLYANYMVDIGPMRKFKSKKDMWAEIASVIENKTPKQCEERYKTVLKRKKAAVENNNASGSKRTNVDFEDEINKICLMDDSLQPEIQISSQKSVKVEKKGNERVEGTKAKKMKTIQETLIEIAEKKEEAKERRHQEKMALLQKLLEKQSES